MWNLKIHDPSGEVRTIPAQGIMTLGREPSADIPLRDPTLPEVSAAIWSAQDQFWLRTLHQSLHAQVGDLKVRESQIPVGIPIVLGETRLTLEQQGMEVTLPALPDRLPPWLTQNEAGAKVLWAIKKTAATPLSVYLAGETGTGKEILAHLVHSWSDRASGPFIPLHCGALPLSLAESELFGHVKGAFTGAHKQRPGALLQAHGGTLFLDEIADLPPDIQVKLLRFLENGEIRPVGADQCMHADVRIVCATHKSLLKLVEEGTFRQDLYFRLASVCVIIPPLRDRPEDIELISRRFATELGRSLSPRALLRLQAHAWPGNVRELRHAIERAAGLAGPFEMVLGEQEFSFLLTPENVQQTPALAFGTSELSLEEMERVMILKALKIARGNRVKAADILGVARSTLFDMMKRHRIKGPMMFN